MAQKYKTVDKIPSTRERRYDDPKYTDVVMPRRVFSPSEPVNISVIVCTYFPVGHIVDYNTRTYVDHTYKRYSHNRLECFKFLLACFNHYDAGLSFELIIVDNSSPDPSANLFLDSMELRAETYPTHVYKRENTFYSFGAYRWAYENLRNNQFYVFMEMDWVPCKHGWLFDFVEKWHSDPQIGMIGNLIEARGTHYPPTNDGQRTNNAFIEKINPARRFHYNLDSEYMFTSRFVLDQMIEHDGWLMYPCQPQATLPPTYNELAFQQPILEMGYKLSCYDDGKRTMFYGIYNRDIDPKWDHGFGPNLAPIIPEQTRCFLPEVREYFDFYDHDKHSSFIRWL